MEEAAKGTWDLARDFAKTFNKVYSKNSKKELASENLKEFRSIWNSQLTIN